MEADFSGWATKARLKCSDGRTIMPDAFAHQDKVRVPLVWQHAHSDPENVLGHAILENRPDGVYAYGYFNDTPKAVHTKSLVEHKDISMMSIWANQLVEKNKQVLHGAIREVSLVLSGANPGAIIENVSIRHSEDDIEERDDEAIIRTGIELELKHSDEGDPAPDADKDDADKDDKDDSKTDEAKHSTTDDDDDDEIDANLEHALGPDATIKDVYDSMNEEQKTVLHFMLGEALESAQHSDIDDDDDTYNADTGNQEGTDTMKHNVFEDAKRTAGPQAGESAVLSHDEIKGIVADAMENGSLKKTVNSYALQHGITNIDQMFPDAVSIDATPEWLARRTEWVSKLLGAVRKTPFARIRTLAADITAEDARAKGYVKGTLKKEEFFAVSKRVTTPTTIYKKQKLDRDDMLDITDFDVVAWLKGEMRLMLDEELARAILFGDGRDVSHEDKINEGNIRPIATDHELYTTTVNVNVSDGSSSVQEIIDAVVTNRKFYKGTGTPTLFTTETYIAMFLLLKDTTGRRIYSGLDEIARELRVSEIVAVEAMEEETDIIAIIVNPVDYIVGADKGGEVNMFDDFDIDYNKYTYLIETRCSGALAKLKAAIVLRSVAASVTLVSPQSPTFVSDTGVVTIPTQVGVTYKKANGDTISAGAMSAITAGSTVTIYSVPSSASYAFNNDEDDNWSFTRESA